MKSKSLVTLFLLLTFASVHSQTLEDAKKHIYYHRYETAKNSLQSLIKNNISTPDAYYWLGEIYLKERKLDSAKKAYRDGTSYLQANNLSNKQYPLPFIGWAHLLLDTGAVADSRIQMEDLLKLSKYKDPVILLAVATAHIDSKNGDVAWAITLLEKAAKKDKKNPEIYTALGDAYKKIIDGSTAIQFYNLALEVAPQYAEAMYKKGLIYKTQNNTEMYIDRFNKAYTIDTTYTPAIYQLYWHFFGKDNAKAKKLLAAYIKYSDQSVDNDYMSADYHYIAGEYQDALHSAMGIIKNNKTVEPRLYKLIAYSYAALKDSSSALNYMKNYIANQKPGQYVSKDFELMAKLHESQSSDKVVVIEWLKKALALETDKNERLQYMMTLADMQQELGNREREAIWREKVYNTKKSPTNLDIYKWGVALYSSEDYIRADSVFSIYQQKYSDQIYGYLWRARCNALIDTTMEKGLAVPHYKKLVEVALKDSIKNKSTLLRAYGYLGTYEANITKDYPASLNYFNKILELDPVNADAAKYKEILEGWIDKGIGLNNNKEDNK